MAPESRPVHVVQWQQTYPPIEILSARLCVVEGGCCWRWWWLVQGLVFRNEPLNCNTQHCTDATDLGPFVPSYRLLFAHKITIDRSFPGDFLLLVYTPCVHVSHSFPLTSLKIRILLLSLAFPGVIIDKLNVHRRINHSSLFHRSLSVVSLLLLFAVLHQSVDCVTLALEDSTVTSRLLSLCLVIVVRCLYFMLIKSSAPPGHSNWSWQCRRLWKLNCSANINCAEESVAFAKLKLSRDNFKTTHQTRRRRRGRGDKLYKMNTKRYTTGGGTIGVQAGTGTGHDTGANVQKNLIAPESKSQIGCGEVKAIVGRNRIAVSYCT